MGAEMPSMPGVMMGAGAVTILAGALRVIEPSWSLEQAMYVASFLVMTVSGAIMLAMMFAKRP